jgi:hypothetical protein
MAGWLVTSGCWGVASVILSVALALRSVSENGLALRSVSENGLALRSVSDEREGSALSLHVARTHPW